MVEDQAFFEQKKWYNFKDCVAKVMMELNRKYAKYEGQENAIWKTIKAYNGSGAAATQYANNVTQYTDYSKVISI